LRFAEKDTSGYWKVRQLGVYHSFDQGTDSHFWLLLQSHPWPKDTLSNRLIELFEHAHSRQVFNACPAMLHEVILETYVPSWRWYLDFLGDMYGKLVSAHIVAVLIALTDQSLAISAVLRSDPI